MAGKLFVISAPSGAGKTTLIKAVLAAMQPYCPIERVITYTSKQPRAQEVDGQDYHFISVADFEAHIANDFFLEWSTAYGAYYGSPKHIIEQLVEGKSYVLIIDRVGAEQVARQIPSAVLIWIRTQTPQILKERLRGRNTENEAKIEHRLSLASAEITREQQQPLYHYHVLNDEFDKAVEELIKIFVSKLEIEPDFDLSKEAFRGSF